MLFFFKQKTAYEMRISDWSSDVCSSDLIAAFHLPDRVDEAVGRRGVARAGDEMQHHFRVGSGLTDGAAGDQLTAQRQAIGEIAVMRDGDAADFQLQIGRATCRERACQ